MIGSDAQDRIAAVGRVGELDLDYVRRGHDTILVRSRCCSPWHLGPPITLDDTGCAYTLLLNPSGGLVGGDRLSVTATVGPNGHVIFSTPSANRIYRSAAKATVQAVTINVGTGAIVEWVPDVVIPFAGSRFHQSIHVTLERGATALVWDAIASGRIAREERWAFTELRNEIEITTASGASVLERYHLGPPSVAADMKAWNYVGSLYLIGDSIAIGTWKELKDRLAAALDEQPAQLLGGISEPAAPGLAIKLVARSAGTLQETFQKLWQEARARLWGLSVPDLRKY